MTNQSLFCQTMRQHGINDFLDIWQDSFKAGKPYQQERAFNDKVETEFWQEYCHTYETKPSLYDYAPQVFDKLLSIVGENKDLIEFGAGTGKFTLPMSAVSKKINVVDFSQDMLNILEGKLKTKKITNVSLMQGKIETANLSSVDAIYGINANYRIFEMEKTIQKMITTAREKICFVWTMQRSPYDCLLMQTAVKGIERKKEYIQLINLLYQMGIDANLENMTVIKPILIENINENKKEINTLATKYQLNTTNLIKAFERKLIEENQQIYYQCPLTISFIYFETENYK